MSPRPILTPVALAATLALIAVTIAACSSSGSRTDGAPVAHHDDHPIHNIQKINDRLISGSGPETPEAFDQLGAMGIKTIISVDGSSPNVALAQARGMRYVHVPITYAAISDAQRLEIARAIRDLPGPIYVHCHHGKHRGPSALAAAAISLGVISNEEGTTFITKAGTAANYTGLYECIASAPVATKDQLNTAPHEFPSVRKAVGTTAAMVEIDTAWEHLGAIKAAGWKTPADNPDLVPAAEAGQLTDNFRIAHADSDYTNAGMGLPDEYIQKMAAAMEHASALEAAIVRDAHADDLGTAYTIVQTSCKDCHTTYRDKAVRHAW